MQRLGAITLGGTALGNSKEIPFSGALDADGVYTIDDVDNADQMDVSAFFQEDPINGQSSLHRIDPTNTTQIKIEADLQGQAAEKLIAGKYWPR